MDSTKDIEALIRSRYPLVFLNTYEETRAGRAGFSSPQACKFRYLIPCQPRFFAKTAKTAAKPTMPASASTMPIIRSAAFKGCPPGGG